MEHIIEKNHFRLERMRHLPDMNGNLWELEHVKSGAKLVWLDRGEENMTFSIAFTTIPEDSTGVFHILEHSVLCGSDRYPVKEPFVELLKSSLQTFLNAMTFPDKTMYPVSSRNRKDFLNLVSIYMDAVFHPAIYHKKEIFLQEGWRYDTGADGAPMYQGVVYNEMKGAYSSVGNAMERVMQTSLFPDNCYRHDSGGDPAVIPELTYEQFLSSHDKFYHPSNARIVLDGVIDLDSVLALLDSYLEPYDRRDISFVIPEQKPVPFHTRRERYVIGADEDPAGKTFVCRGVLLGDYQDRELHMAANLLADYLSDGSEAPLTRAILDEGLAADFSVSLNEGTRQAWFGWEAQNTDPDKLPRIREVVKETVERIIREGLDKNRLEAYISNLAFQLTSRDGGGSRGVYESINVLSSWLYGGDPAQNLCFTEALRHVREMLDTDYFAQLLRRCMLDESTGVLAVLEPSTTLGEEIDQAEQSRLETGWAALSEEARALCREEVRALRLWQHTPDSPEALASIPVLSVADLPETLTQELVEEEPGYTVPVLRQELGSPLSYFTLFFGATDLTLEELPLLTLLRNLLGKLPTDRYDSAALKLECLKTVGSMNFQINTHFRTADSCNLNFACSMVCLREKQQAAAELLCHILESSRFDQLGLLRETLQQTRNRFHRALITSGRQFAMGRVDAKLYSHGVASEYLSGCEFIRWLNAHTDESNEAMEALMGQIRALAKRVFTGDRLVVQVSETVEESTVQSFLKCLPTDGVKVSRYVTYPTLPVVNEGIEIPSQVAYAVKAGEMGQVCQPYAGSTIVFNNIVSFSYLWNAIRVQGGAYGAGIVVNVDGRFMFHTYRDPDANRSLECFDDTGRFMEEFCRETDSLERFIIGAVSDYDRLRSNAAKFNNGGSRYFRGMTRERLDNIYTQLVHTTREDILAQSRAMGEAVKDTVCCVAGSREQLERCGDKLQSVLRLLA